MQESLFDAMGAIAGLSPEAVKDGRLQRRPMNTHIHLPPNFSAFESVDQAIELADQQEIEVLGLSNYYDYSLYNDFADQAWIRGIFPLFGTEIICLLEELRDSGVKINDPGNPGKMYICGKGVSRFSPMSERASELLATIRKNDSERMAAMIERIEAVFTAAGIPTGIDEASVKSMIAERHQCSLETVYIQERHIAQAFQAAVFQKFSGDKRLAALEQVFGVPSKASGPKDHVTVQNEIRSHLMKSGKPAFVEETFVGFEHARDLILELGGIPSYPTLADGVDPICGFEETPEHLIGQIQSLGLLAAEFIPTRNEPEVLTEYVTRMRAAGMVITAGTEHNTLDLIPIAPTCKGGTPIPERVADIFWEGACVVIAHQYLRSRGEIGLTDDQGHLNSRWQEPQEAISAMALLGQQILKAFHTITR